MAQRSGETKEQAVQTLETETGRRLAAVRVFYRWDAPFPTDYEKWLKATGHTVMMSVIARKLDGTWIPWRSIADAQPGSQLYADIVSWAQRVRDFGIPLFFIFHQEADLQANQAAGTKTDFIDAWRKVITVFRQQGAENAEFVWTLTGYAYSRDPNVDSAAAKYWYPGDEYVDDIGADMYNWYQCRNGQLNPWKSFADIIDPPNSTYSFLKFGLTHPTKALVLPEYGSVEDPALTGRKGDWFTSAEATLKSSAYSQFKAVMYFHTEDVTSTRACYWWADTTPSSITGFSSLGNDPYFGVYPATPDTTPPATPAGLQGTAVSAKRIDLSWTAASDDVGVAGYDVYRDGNLVGSTQTTSYSDTTVASSTTYSYTVQARDYAKNLSGLSDAALVATPDVIPPTAPGLVQATPTSPTTVDVSWDPATDDLGVTGYDVYRDGILMASVTGTTFTDTGLSPATNYSYTVQARDAAGNTSPPSTAASAITVPDTTPPSPPTGLTAEAVGPAKVSLSWGAATDDIALGAYDVYRDGILIDATNDTTLMDKGLSPQSTYGYEVKARDAAGNPSASGAEAAATTPADTTPPGVPSITAQIGADGKSVVLEWPAVADDVAIAGYDVYRGGAYLDTTTATAYTDGSVSSGASYGYQVEARDTSNNPSGLSTEAAITLPDFIPPEAPLNLVATAVGQTSVDLTWGPATGAGVTGYDVYRGGSLIGSTNAPETSYHDTGLSPATPYSYTVRARDQAGNSSPESAQLDVTTVADTTAPDTPSPVAALGEDRTSVAINWSPVSDDVGTSGYDLYRNGSFLRSLAATTYTDTGLAPGTYTYSVVATDAAGNRSQPGTTEPVTVPDLAAPSVPAGLTAAPASLASVQLGWNPATDNVGVAYYDVYRGGALIGSTVLTTYVDPTITGPGAYTYTVRARDAAGNASAQSASASATIGTPVFSDGFESGNLSKWTKSSGVSLQTAGQYAGRYAARARSATSTSLGYAMARLGSSYRDLYYRSWIKVASQSASTATLLRVQTATGSGIVSVFRNSTGNLMIRNDTSGATVWSPAVLSTGAWHRLEIHARVDGAASQVEVWLDGTRVSALSTTLFLGSTFISRVLIGETAKSRIYEIWFDDVVAATSYIG